MTDAEISLLRSLAEADVVTFMPEDNTAAAARCTRAGREALRMLGDACRWPRSVPHYLEGVMGRSLGRLRLHTRVLSHE
jgi:hypothetical protein